MSVKFLTYQRMLSLQQDIQQALGRRAQVMSQVQSSSPQLRAQVPPYLTDPVSWGWHMLTND